MRINRQTVFSVTNSMRKRIYVFPVTRWFYQKGQWVSSCFFPSSLAQMYMDKDTFGICTYEHHTDLQPSLCLTAPSQKIRQNIMAAQYVKWLLLIVVLVWFGFFSLQKYI